jgi:hypothetical protein
MMLADAYAAVWENLLGGTASGRVPFKIMQAATIGLDGAPAVRSIVLRRVSEADNVITFHTDMRSPKIAELKNDRRIALVGVDPDRNVQIRIQGEARIVREWQARKAAWESSRAQSLIVYQTTLPPGTPVDRPIAAAAQNPDVLQAFDGFENFCVVEVRPSMIDWLDLSSADVSERARFVWVLDVWEGRWIAP